MAKLPDGWIFTLRQDAKDRRKIVMEAKEIVLCRSCRHYNKECCGEGFGWCERRDFGTHDEWYCADAEAKDNE